MQFVYVALFLVLIAVVAVIGMRLVKAQSSTPQVTAVAPAPTVAPTIDIAPIIAAVKESLDINALSTGVQGMVEAKIRETATAVLDNANAQAKELADERLAAQRQALEDQTKNLLQPFEQQMSNLHQEVTKLRDQNTEKFGNVDRAVEGLAIQAQALNNVLSSAQGRGNWGERMLEDILSQSGFQRGINYEKQEILVEGGRPDYSFFLPPDRVMYLDSKFPLDNYIKYFQAADDNARASYAALFIKNVEDRVKELEKRDYVAQSNRSPLDYVLLFIPNEGVLGFIQQHKPTLVDDAVAKKVVLCSPLTLYAFLGVVRQATDSFHMEQNANEVLSLLQSFSKAWAQYVKYLTEIQKHFDNIQKKLKAVTTGRVMSNLRKPLREIEALAEAREIAGSDQTLAEITQAFDIAESDEDDEIDD